MVFLTENIPNEKVPLSLRRSSVNVTKVVSKHFGKQQLLQRLVVDFEACMDITHGNDEMTKPTRAGKSSKTPRNQVPPAAVAELYGAHIPAPHVNENTNRKYQFRYTIFGLFVTCFWLFLW